MGEKHYSLNFCLLLVTIVLKTRHIVFAPKNHPKNFFHITGTKWTDLMPNTHRRQFSCLRATIFMFTGNNSPVLDKTNFNVLLSYRHSIHVWTLNMAMIIRWAQTIAIIILKNQSSYLLYPCGWCLSEQPWTVSSPSSFSEKQTKSRNEST